MDHKTCRSCNVLLPLTDFPISSRDGVHYDCKVCRNVKLKRNRDNRLKELSVYTGVKVCPGCSLTTADVYTYFSRSKSYKDGLNKLCKCCDSMKKKEQRVRNKERVSPPFSFNKQCPACQIVYPNPYISFSVHRSNSSGLCTNCKKCDNERLSFYKKNNKNVVRNSNAKRRSTKLSAAPVWADKCKIKDIYYQALLMSQSTGEKYVVDHIDPLISSVVCGLHVENNLQVITAYENLVKGNRFTPYQVSF